MPKVRTYTTLQEGKKERPLHSGTEKAEPSAEYVRFYAEGASLSINVDVVNQIIYLIILSLIIRNHLFWSFICISVKIFFLQYSDVFYYRILNSVNKSIANYQCVGIAYTSMWRMSNDISRYIIKRRNTLTKRSRLVTGAGLGLCV